MCRISNWRCCRRGGASEHSSVSVGAAGERGAVGQQVQQAALLAGLEQPVEARAEDLLGRVAEHALDRRALVEHGRVGVEHRDQVARVLHERAEARLAGAAVDLLAQRGAVERQ